MVWSKRRVKQIEKKVKETWTMCGTIIAGSREELAYIYAERDLYTFFDTLQNSPRICWIEHDDEVQLVDWIPF